MENSPSKKWIPIKITEKCAKWFVHNIIAIKSLRRIHLNSMIGSNQFTGLFFSRVECNVEISRRPKQIDGRTFQFVLLLFLFNYYCRWSGFFFLSLLHIHNRRVKCHDTDYYEIKKKKNDRIAFALSLCFTHRSKTTCHHGHVLVANTIVKQFCNANAGRMSIIRCLLNVWMFECATTKNAFYSWNGM